MSYLVTTQCQALGVYVVPTVLRFIHGDGDNQAKAGILLYISVAMTKH